ncbi:MAG: hypothetical protein LBP62_03535 [Clostridiales bacterium]|jgi:hypothetical protein|nr:hypothetical protein [Clostridiales bacterium]
MAGYKINSIDIMKLCEVGEYTNDSRTEARAGTYSFQSKYPNAKIGGTAINSSGGTFNDGTNKLTAFVADKFYSGTNYIDLPYKIDGSSMRIAKKGCVPRFKSFGGYAYQSSSIIITKAPSKYAANKAQMPEGSIFISTDGGNTFSEVSALKNLDAKVIFIEVQGSGGGGGGASGGMFVYNPGGGGGSGGYILFGVDFSALAKDSSGKYGYITVTLGGSGSGGSGSTNDGAAGGTGASSSIVINYGTNSTHTFTVYGGACGGGGKCMGSSVGNGGDGGGVACNNPTPIGITVLGAIAGKNGAAGGSSAGALSGSIDVQVPSYGSKIYNTSGGAAGSGNSPGGGGGASVFGNGGQGGDKMSGSGSAKDGKQGTGYGTGGGGGGGNNHLTLAGGGGASGKPSYVTFYY